jgi:molybdopterin-containing oxidoreductase family iron-sulfur binding subunit
MPSQESKRNFALMRDKILSEGGKQYWRSIDEYVDSPEFEEFVKREYPVHSEDWNTSFSRRNFVKLMGATLAFAGLSGCVIQPAEKIVPYVRTTPDMLPGVPLFFATAMSIGGHATGLLAKSYEGRPVKLEGNPEHPGSNGSTHVFAQAALLDMYDPDRSQEVQFRGTPKSWQNFMTSIRSAIEENRVDGGGGIRFLTPTVTSPTLIDQFRRLRAELPNFRWYQYEPVNNDNAMAGARMAFGSPVHSVYRFDQAERILSLDADIFSGTNPRYMGDTIAGRRVNEQRHEMNRMYVVETTVSLMGAKADHRLAVKPSQMPEIAKAIAAALGVGGATSTYSQNGSWISAMAKDLMEHRGRSLVVAGDNQPPIVHALAHAMNGALGNVGTTVTYTDPLAVSERTQIEGLRELVTDIDAGRVKMLVIMGGNPTYNTPADLRLNRERLDKIPLRIHQGLYFDETAEHCHWHINGKHFLESWSDARGYDGTASIVQPLIQPLYAGHNEHELVQLFFRENFDQRDIDIVKGFWQTQNINMSRPAAAVTSTPQTHSSEAASTEGHGAQPAASPAPANRPAANSAQPAAPQAPRPAANSAAPAATATFDDNWRRIVHDGVVPNSASPARTMAANAGFLSAQQATPASSGNIEISILPDPSIYDGRFANNGWLQELPNPLTKVTWENVALISPATAARLGLNRGNDPDEVSGGERGIAFINTRGSNMTADVVTLNYQGANISKGVPVWIQPGQPDDVVTIYQGYGRTRAGRIGTGIGYNAFDVMRSDAVNFGFGTLTATGEKATIATTQIHFNLEGRDILRVFDHDVFEATPEKWHQPDEYPKTMYQDAAKQYQEQYARHYKWGMTIDLNACVGCNACVIACQAENNIPVVGKEQVERNREMQWLRIDSYYGGEDVGNPNGPHFQPILCQQCEQAPCEVVCPVTATVHSAEGLNDMVYNRCVGTRYCSNNCPYKVRRFNFLLYQDWDTPQYKLMRNPDVTIRSRGVMEKCTYCTQRISAARIEAEKDGRAIRDGEVVTACQAACPTNAFTFGDLNDPNSEVSKAKKDHRDYKLLNELNTQPRTTYLAGFKNQNKEMPDYKPLPTPPEHRQTEAGGGGTKPKPEVETGH